MVPLRPGTYDGEAIHLLNHNPIKRKQGAKKVNITNFLAIALEHNFANSVLCFPIFFINSNCNNENRFQAFTKRCMQFSTEVNNSTVSRRNKRKINQLAENTHSN